MQTNQKIFAFKMCKFSINRLESIIYIKKKVKNPIIADLHTLHASFHRAVDNWMQDVLFHQTSSSDSSSRILSVLIFMVIFMEFDLHSVIEMSYKFYLYTC